MIRLEAGSMPFVTGEAVLFAFDDHAIPDRSNLRVRMHPARKHPGNPVLRPGPSGSPDEQGACIYGTVIRVDGLFRMWYLAWPAEAWEQPSLTLNGVSRPIAYAESTDGVTWTKPDLGLVEFRGNTHNNLVLIEPGDAPEWASDDDLCVLHDPEAPADERYKLAHITFVEGNRISPELSSQPRPTMVCAVSGDGVRWRRTSGGLPVSEVFEVAALYRFGGVYHAAGQQIDPFATRLCARARHAGGGSAHGRRDLQPRERAGRDLRHVARCASGNRRRPLPPRAQRTD